MITFENVTRTFLPAGVNSSNLRSKLAFFRPADQSPFIALDNVSFHIPPGGALGIIGNNGSGKSTLLKILTRVIRPTSGRVIVGGKISSLLEVGAGFHHDLSGRENIFLSGAIMGMSSCEVSKRLEVITNFSGLKSFLDQPVKTYSSGMFMRLAFSIGIHLDADILVIDEALSVGDSNFQLKCIEQIHSFRKAGGTLVFVSHDCSLLLNVCEQGMVLSNGKVSFDGDINRALSFYASH